MIFQDWFSDVRRFEDKFGVSVGNTPNIPSDEKVKILRKKLHLEEFEELTRALDSNDLEEIADGIVDLIYVLIGTAISYGIDIRPVWAEVHRANMKKVGGGQRADGKIMKPEGWQPPDIKGVLLRQLGGFGLQGLPIQMSSIKKEKST